MNALSSLLASLMLFWLSAAINPRIAHADPPAKASEYHVKAAFIYNFAKFIDWPDQASKGPLVLCVMGKGPARHAFNDFKDKKVKGNELDLLYADEIADLGRCNIIYISSTDAGRIADVLDSVRGESVLTIGESPEFIRSGGIINFISRDKKVRFEINPKAALRARLSISSQLLKLADIREDQ